jgi:hypothetical protein
MRTRRGQSARVTPTPSNGPAAVGTSGTRIRVSVFLYELTLPYKKINMAILTFCLFRRRSPTRTLLFLCHDVESGAPCAKMAFTAARALTHVTYDGILTRDC